MSFSQVEIPKGTWIYVSADLSSNANNVQIAPGRPLLLLEANAKPGVHYVVHDQAPYRKYYVKASDVTITPLYDVPPTPDCPPATATDCKVFSEAAYASGKTDGMIAGEITGKVKGVDEGISQEQARIKNVLGLK